MNGGNTMARNTMAVFAVLMIGILFSSGSAAAQNSIEIGGKTSLAADFSIATTNPDFGPKSTILVLSGLGAYTTKSGRFETGAGLTIPGLFSDIDASIVQLTAQTRINTDLMGPEENVLFYGSSVPRSSG